MVKGKIERTIVPILVGKKESKAALRNIKRPPQVLPGRSGTGNAVEDPGSSGSTDWQ